MFTALEKVGPNLGNHMPWGILGAEGCKKEDVYRYVLEASQRSRPSVDTALGLRR